MDKVSTSPQTPEQAQKPSRKENIRRLLDNGKIPMLPFEIDVVWRRFMALAVDQDERSQQMMAAMSESSETFHDNSPAEIFAWDSAITTEQARYLVEMRNISSEVEYPEASETSATLGSIVYIEYEDGDIEPVYLTGFVRNADDVTHIQLPHDTDIVTLQTPLGKALLDAKEGDIVSYDANDKTYHVVVSSILVLP